MMRWLREVTAPSLRCERVGHRWRVEHRSGLARPWWPGVADQGLHYRCVADRFHQRREVCHRCHAPHPEFGEWKTTRSECRQGIHLDTFTYDQLSRNGVVFL